VDGFFRDKFVALERDKCEFVYLAARSIGAVNIVEAGTSFGVSTMYLALAVGQNVHDGRSSSSAGKVIGTEKEPEKAAKARSIWNEAGHEEVAKWIDLRVGDLRTTLKADLPETIDMLLLDSESSTKLLAIYGYHSL
jgi:predicted O-methyltransferase YrrM